MKLSSVALGGLLAVAPLGQTAALAYTFTPAGTRALMRGSVILAGPNGGFRCKAHFVIKTPAASSDKHAARISSMKVEGDPPCDTVGFFPPSIAHATGLNKGRTGILYNVPGEGVVCETDLFFTVDASGDWTFPPGTCFVGTLRTNPPVTITP